MTLGDRLKSIRKQLGLSQEALGTQGFVSTPGWIKIENSQRQASERLIAKLTDWLAEEKHVRASAAKTLKEELLILKYLGNRSPFVREMAKMRAEALPDGGAALFVEMPKGTKSRRGRPARKKSTSGVALVAETPGVYKVKRVRS